MQNTLIVQICKTQNKCETQCTVENHNTNWQNTTQTDENTTQISENATHTSRASLQLTSDICSQVPYFFEQERITRVYIFGFFLIW